MEQRGFKQVDLVPFIGSRSKVSEILSGKRQLSLAMMRKLHEGLNIPADVLMKEPKREIPEETDIQWDNFPLAELNKRNWFPTYTDTVHRLKDYAEDLMRPKIDYLIQHCSAPILPSGSLNRFRSKKEIDVYALISWQAKVVEKAVENPLQIEYSKDNIEQITENISKLTIFDDGPLYARELLNKNGIHLIIESHFDRTFLDGGVMVLENGVPVIGLTLRYNRLDNFWFSLLHELVHLARHFDGDKTPYFDDFDQKDNIESFETEADTLASELLIPKEKWPKTKSDHYAQTGSFEEISQHAKELNVHEAILVGRIHFDSGNYNRYRKFLGKGIPSKLFRVDKSS
jgi:HTH-type transcriptional regulator/antitoxin HigA